MDFDDKFKVSRWVDSGGVNGYYDWLMNNELASKIWPGTSLLFPSEIHNAVTLKVPLPLIPEVKVLLNLGKGIYAGPELATPLPNHVGTDIALEGTFSVGPLEVTGISLSEEMITVNYLGKSHTLSILSVEALKDDIVDLGINNFAAESFSGDVFVIIDAIHAFGATVMDNVFTEYLTASTSDLSESEGAVNVDLTSGVAFSTVNEVSVGIGDRVNVIGSSFGDSLFGSNQDNSIDGGKGHDYIVGGGGADILDGGGGRDTLSYVESGSGVTVNLADGVGIGGDADGDTFTNFEVVVGSDHADTISSGGSGSVLFAGMDGDDTFNIVASGKGPSIIWGGAGDDTIRIQIDEYKGPAGIIVVEASNLSSENFHLFDLEMLGFGHAFDWTQIDAIILNPDSGDRVELADSEASYEISVGVVSEDIWRVVRTEDDDFIYQWYGEMQYAGYEQDFHFNNGIYEFQGAVRNYSQSFLSGYYGAVFAPARTIETLTIVEYRDENNETFVHLPAAPEAEEEEERDHPYVDVPLAQGLELGGSGWDYEIDREYDFSSAVAASQWTTEDGSYGSREHFFFGFSSEPIDAANGWFVIGGSFSGASLMSTGAITVALPNPDGSTPGSAGGGPFGGSYGKAPLGLNMKSGDGTMRLGNFDPAKQAIVIDGTALSPTTLMTGMSATEVNGSTVIQNGDDDFIVLRGVSLTEWESGSAAQILGDSGNDSLSGTSSADVFTGGGGNDTIVAGADDDWINYTSGDDLIMGDSGNTGQDTLDLSRYISWEVTLSVSGDDVLISTPDGTIRLHNQVGYDPGHENSNIETLLFADASYDEWGIRFRSISDQTTEGDDSVSGTAHSDGIWAGDGNDTIAAHAGDDTVIGGAGDDILYGGDGDDILDGGLGADQFVFLVSNGVDTIEDFNDLNGGGAQGDILRFDNLLSGSFAYLGDDSFTGTGNTEARVFAEQVLIDTNGDGFSDITINLSGLTSASQLLASDFFFL